MQYIKKYSLYAIFPMLFLASALLIQPDTVFSRPCAVGEDPSMANDFCSCDGETPSMANNFCDDSFDSGRASVGGEDRLKVGDKPTDFKSFVDIVTDLIGSFVVMAIALTFVAFVFHVIKGFIIKGGDEEGIKEGKRVVLIGLVAFVIILTIWGILKLLRNAFFGI